MTRSPLLVIGARQLSDLPVPADGLTLLFTPHSASPVVPSDAAAILVLLDDGGDGLATINALARANVPPPLIAVDAAQSEERVHQALAAGADEYAAPGHLPGGSMTALVRRAEARKRAAAGHRKVISAVAIEMGEVNRRLSSSNDELRIFSQTVAHDLGSPLSQIALYAELLEKENANVPDGKSGHYSRRIRDAARRAAGLLDSLYLSAKSGADAEPMTDVNLSTVLAEVLADSEHRLAEAGAKVRVGTLPQVRARARQMYQVLANLVDNALKHSSGPSPLIDVNAVSLDREWVVSVKDNGVGVPEEHWQAIFEPYRRLTGGHRAGFGIGLSICRKIVEGHGGRIWVNSAPGKGATFYFTIPATTAR